MRLFLLHVTIPAQTALVARVHIRPHHVARVQAGGINVPRQFFNVPAAGDNARAVPAVGDMASGVFVQFFLSDVKIVLVEIWVDPLNGADLSLNRLRPNELEPCGAAP
jgi:hypothetical protein